MAFRLLSSAVVLKRFTNNKGGKMKHILLYCAVSICFVSMAMADQVVRVQSENPQTIQSILAVKLSNPERMDCDTPPQEDWQCSSEVTGRHTDLMGHGCSSPSSWACLETNLETCTETHSGRTHTRTYDTFVGCVESLSDCW